GAAVPPRRQGRPRDRRRRRWVHGRRDRGRARTAQHARTRVRGGRNGHCLERPRRRRTGTLGDARGGGVMAEGPVRVMLVDDHEVVREGLRKLLSRNKGMLVVAEAGTMAEAIETATRAKPDVIVMDVRLPDGSGVEACRTIREARPETKVVMLTSYADDEALFASIVAGAAGYLLKQTRGQAVVDAINAVAQGRSLLDHDVTGKVLERVRKGRGDEDPAF